MATLKSPEITVEITHKNRTVQLGVQGISEQGGRFSGAVSFYCDSEYFAKFVAGLRELYDTLREGETSLHDYPDDNYIKFVSDGMGHFEVSGVFGNWKRWTLNFSETVEQSYFKNFIYELRQM